MKLLVGLGNPGARYEKNRHNMGFMVIDALAQQGGVSVNKKQGQALIGQMFISGKKVLLVKPQTYMNLSGQAVMELLNYYQDRIDDIIVIHDDLDLEFGRLRFKRGGGTGGHNGLKSISRMLNSPDYSRLKIGIGKPPDAMKVENYVLSDFLPEESIDLPQLIQQSLEGLRTWCLEGIEKAMNKFNAII